MDFLILHEDLLDTAEGHTGKSFPNKAHFSAKGVMKHGNSIHCSTLDLASLNARNRSAAKECYLRKELCLEGMALRLCIVPSYHAFKMMYATALISALPVVAVACVLPYSKGFKALSCHRSNNYSESKRNDHLDNNRRQEQRNKELLKYMSSEGSKMLALRYVGGNVGFGWNHSMDQVEKSDKNFHRPGGLPLAIMVFQRFIRSCVVVEQRVYGYEGPSLDESLENEEHLDVDSCDLDSPKNVNNDSVLPSSRVLREEDVSWWKSWSSFSGDVVMLPTDDKGCDASNYFVERLIPTISDLELLNNLKEAILLHNALSRQTKDAG
ncbi:hypothetical protein Tco_1133276 [Tanacetum coccineum]